MQTLSKTDVIESYRKAYQSIPAEALELDFRLTIRTMQGLAKGQPLSPEALATMWEVPLEQVGAVLKAAAANGSAEINEEGNLVGGILSLKPTAHSVFLDNQHLYAWCAYDAIYAPGVLAEPVRIESRDPVTGTPIKVIISPQGVDEVKPKSTVVSVVKGDSDMRGGPESPRCSQMLFFESSDSAKQWLKDRSDVAILTVEEAFELAREFQIEPAKRLGLI